LLDKQCFYKTEVETFVFKSSLITIFVQFSRCLLGFSERPYSIFMCWKCNYHTWDEKKIFLFSDSTNRL